MNQKIKELKEMIESGERYDLADMADLSLALLEVIELQRVALASGSCRMEAGWTCTGRHLFHDPLCPKCKVLETTDKMLKEIGGRDDK